MKLFVLMAIVVLMLTTCKNSHYLKMKYSLTCHGMDTHKVRCQAMNLDIYLAEWEATLDKIIDGKEEIIKCRGVDTYNKTVGFFQKYISELEAQQPNFIERWFFSDRYWEPVERASLVSYGERLTGFIENTDCLGKVDEVISKNNEVSQASSSVQLTETLFASASEAVVTSSLAELKVEPPISKSISDFIKSHSQDDDCGDLKEVYCKSELTKKAAEIAYSESIACEQTNVASQGCFLTGNEFIEREISKLEISELTKAKIKYEKYIEFPEKYNANTRGKIDLIAGRCKKEAIANGLRNGDYYDYVKNTCLPLARQEFLQPQSDILIKINKKLDSLGFS